MKKNASLLLLLCTLFFTSFNQAQNWLVGGNNEPGNSVFGLTSNKRIDFITNNKERGRLTKEGFWGFGNTEPLAQVHINSTDALRNPLQIDVLDTAKMIVYSNGGVAIGNTKLPPPNGLFVSGKLGIGTNTPDVKLHVTGGTNVSLSDGGTIVAGPVNTFNLAIDNTEIQTRNNGAASSLQINQYGGNVNIGSNGLFFQSANKFVGVGTTAPAVPLNVVGGGALSLSGGGTIVAGSTNTFNLGISSGSIQARNNAAGSLLSLNADGGDINISRGALFVESATNNVGIGAAPSAKFHVVVGTDATLTDGGYIVAGPTSSKNVVIDENEIMARDNGAASTLFVNNNGGDVNLGGGAFIISGSLNNVGIKTPPNNHTLQVGSGGDVLGIGNAETLEDFDNFTIGTNSNFVTLTDDLASLGTSVRRWRQLWAIDGSINTSDARDKTNIKDLNYGLKEIMQLRSVRFNWKDKIEKGEKLGLIAQDLQKVLPEVVRDYEYKTDEQTGKTEKVPAARLGVMYADIIPVLIRGMQEQQMRIEALEKAAGNHSSNEAITFIKDENTLNVKLSNTLLDQNIPNPLKNNTSIRYNIPVDTKNASLLITDMNGRSIKQLTIKAGSGIINIDASSLNAGTFNYTLIVDGRTVETKRMMVVK